MDSVASFLRRFGQLVRPILTHPIAILETLLPMYYPRSKRRFSPATDISSLEGKVIFVTGGNNGLGKETVLQLAKHRPRKIWLGARSEQKAQDAIQSIQTELDEKVDIEHVSVDLTALQSIKAAAERIQSRSDRLDIVVLNAGVMAMPMSTTEAGFEIHMGTNHVGHHLLTRLLLSMLAKTAAEPDSDVRVIVVASDGYLLAPRFDTIISPTKLNKQGSMIRYAASKVANILFAQQFARRYPSITCVSLHPGIVMTDLHNQGRKDGNAMLLILKSLASLLGVSVADGALNQVWCAAGAKKEELTSGGYYTVQTLREWNPWARDEAAGRKLWEWTEKGLAKAGF